MKKALNKIIIIVSFVISPLLIISSQADNPPPPNYIAVQNYPVNKSGGGPVGGGAPINGGFSILLAMGGIYIIQKIFFQKKAD